MQTEFQSFLYSIDNFILHLVKFFPSCYRKSKDNINFSDTPPPYFPSPCLLSFQPPNFFLSPPHCVFPASRFRLPKKFCPLNFFFFQLRCRHLTCLNLLCYGGGSSWQDGTCATTCASCQRGKPLWTPQSCSALRFSQLKCEIQKGKAPVEFWQPCMIYRINCA